MGAARQSEDVSGSLHSCGPHSGSFLSVGFLVENQLRKRWSTGDLTCGNLHGVMEGRKSSTPCSLYESGPFIRLDAQSWVSSGLALQLYFLDT